MSELKWFIVGLIVLWFLWAATGGTTRLENRNRELLQQPIDGGNIYSINELYSGTTP